jgi:hypothetical protein
MEGNHFSLYPSMLAGLNCSGFGRNSSMLVSGSRLMRQALREKQGVVSSH